MEKKTFIVLSLVLAIMIAGCTTTTIIENNNENPENNQGASDGLKKFNSKQEIMDFLEKSQSASYSYAGGFKSLSMDRMAVAEAVPVAGGMADSSGSGQMASDYSQTNVQVEGVDEADFIKNDGKYIYLISGNSLVIVDAYPADKADIISETDLDGYVNDMFVSGDRLVVFMQRNDEGYAFPEYDIIPRQVYKQNTHAVIYDISDRENPEEINDLEVSGNYMTSRMIDDKVYLISQDYVYYYNRVLDLPSVQSSGKMVMRPDVYYFDVADNNYNFNTVMSFDIKTGDSVEAKTFLMGYSNVIYVSENNLYITYQKSFPYRYYESHNEERFYDVLVPLLSSQIQNEINAVKKDSSLNSYEKWDRISAIIEKMYNNMDEDDKDKIMQDFQDAIDEYEIKKEEDMRKTVIQKINIDDGKLEYKGKGEVKGYLLNQFSMDENEGYLRVATNFNSWISGDSVQYNNVYVLDEDMDIAGSLEKIAPDESIYSARFMGDRLYMVTFKRIDPFFVIDLSNPGRPKILGELKIPGYSDYLHPYDESHIIGLGKETADNEWGGVSVKGVKLAMFDVSDVENPKIVDKYDIGTSGTESEALNEHKAFLFDRKKNLLVIPVREIKAKQTYDPRYGYYRQRVWQGAYVFDVTDDGFDLKGKVSHREYDEQEYWYYGSPNAVRRSLFMDDVLYTISESRIMMNSLDDLEEINTVKLPYQENYYPYPLYKGGAMMEADMATIN